jgi:hypothetical protein
MTMETNFVLVVLPLPAATIRLVDAGLRCEIRWESVSGRTYQVQFKELLGNGGWTDLGLPMVAETSSLVFSDSMPAGAASRFYRIVAVEGVP